jgi:hypothetical protein
MPRIVENNASHASGTLIVNDLISTGALSDCSEQQAGSRSIDFGEMK